MTFLKWLLCCCYYFISKTMLFWGKELWLYVVRGCQHGDIYIQILLSMKFSCSHCIKRQTSGHSPDCDSQTNVHPSPSQLLRAQREPRALASGSTWSQRWVPSWQPAWEHLPFFPPVLSTSAWRSFGFWGYISKHKGHTLLQRRGSNDCNT